ncbi:MAG: hypothetical protein ACOYWZ_11765 [Bacillota bacterium]
MRVLKLKDGSEVKLNEIRSLQNGWQEALVQVKEGNSSYWGKEKNYIICGSDSLKYIIINGEKVFINGFK